MSRGEMDIQSFVKLIPTHVGSGQIKLETERAYAAVVVDAVLGQSKSGNPMVTVEFRLNRNGSRVRGYYVLNYPTGAGKFANLVELAGVRSSSDRGPFRFSRLTYDRRAQLLQK